MVVVVVAAGAPVASGATVVVDLVSLWAAAPGGAGSVVVVWVVSVLFCTATAFPDSSGTAVVLVVLWVVVVWVWAGVSGATVGVGLVAFFRSAPVTGFCVTSCAIALVERASARAPARLCRWSFMTCSGCGFGPTTNSPPSGCIPIGEPFEVRDDVSARGRSG